MTKKLSDSWFKFPDDIQMGSSWFLFFDSQFHEIDKEKGIEMNILNKLIAQWNSPLTTIDKIEQIRSENNKNWMNLLRLSLKYAPEEAKEIFNKITECDAKINKLMKELSDE